jgi:5-methylcytosine-specific restriction endonuclease McrA
MKSLVLNANMQPISVISWEDAIQNILSGKAALLEKHIGKKIRTVSQDFDMPSVVLCLTPIPYRTEKVSCNAQNIFLRDKYICAYCGQRKRKSELTRDHIKPIVQGGKNSWMNLITACKPCNQKKGGRTPKQAKMELKYQPFEPAPTSSHLLTSANRELLNLWSEYLEGAEKVLLSTPAEVE